MREGSRIHPDSWLDVSNDQDEKSCTSSTCTSSIGEESMDDNSNSNGSSTICSSDITDDASSYFSSQGAALYDLSEIMSQLPIKRGLSKFYEGKSESFTSLSRVTSTEDLAKKTNNNTPYRRNLKASKSCGNGLNSYKPYTLPKSAISKKTTRLSSFSSFPTKRGTPPLCSSSPSPQSFPCTTTFNVN